MIGPTRWERPSDSIPCAPWHDLLGRKKLGIGFLQETHHTRSNVFEQNGASTQRTMSIYGHDMSSYVWPWASVCVMSTSSSYSNVCWKFRTSVLCSAFFFDKEMDEEQSTVISHAPLAQTLTRSALRKASMAKVIHHIVGRRYVPVGTPPCLSSSNDAAKDRAAAHPKMAPHRNLHACSALFFKIGGSDLVLRMSGHGHPCI